MAYRQGLSNYIDGQNGIVSDDNQKRKRMTPEEIEAAIVDMPFDPALQSSDDSDQVVVNDDNAEIVVEQSDDSSNRDLNVVSGSLFNVDEDNNVFGVVDVDTDQSVIVNDDTSSVSDVSVRDGAVDDSVRVDNDVDQYDVIEDVSVSNESLDVVSVVDDDRLLRESSRDGVNNDYFGNGSDDPLEYMNNGFPKQDIVDYDEERVSGRRLPRCPVNGLYDYVAGQRVSASVKNASSSICRNVPKGILAYVRSFFPSCKNNTDALVAYILTHCDQSFAMSMHDEITEEQARLIASYSGDFGMEQEEKLQQIISRLDNIGKILSVVELLSGYVVFDRLGYRRDNPVDPRKIDFLEDDFLPLLLNAERQSNTMRKRRNERVGRIHPKSKDAHLRPDEGRRKKKR